MLLDGDKVGRKDTGACQFLHAAQLRGLWCNFSFRAIKERKKGSRREIYHLARKFETFFLNCTERDKNEIVVLQILLPSVLRINHRGDMSERKTTIAKRR